MGREVDHVAASLLAVLVVSVLLAAVARRYDVRRRWRWWWPASGQACCPGLRGIELEPELVLFVILPPLLWSAGLEPAVALRKNLRPIGLLAVDTCWRRRSQLGWLPSTPCRS